MNISKIFTSLLALSVAPVFAAASSSVTTHIDDKEPNIKGALLAPKYTDAFAYLDTKCSEENRRHAHLTHLYLNGDAEYYIPVDYEKALQHYGHLTQNHESVDVFLQYFSVHQAKRLEEAEHNFKAAYQLYLYLGLYSPTKNPYYLFDAARMRARMSQKEQHILSGNDLLELAINHMFDEEAHRFRLIGHEGDLYRQWGNPKLTFQAQYAKLNPSLQRHALGYLATLPVTQEIRLNLESIFDVASDSEIGHALEGRGLLEAAKTWYLHTAEIDPLNFYDAARLAKALGILEEECALLRQAIDRTPMHARLYFPEEYAKMDENTRAFVFNYIEEKILTRNSDMTNLGEIICTILNINIPNNLAHYNERQINDIGVAFEKMGRYETAIAWYNQEQTVSNYLSLACLYKRMDNIEGAHSYLRRFVDDFRYMHRQYLTSLDSDLFSYMHNYALETSTSPTLLRALNAHVKHTDLRDITLLTIVESLARISFDQLAKGQKDDTFQYFLDQMVTLSLFETPENIELLKQILLEERKPIHRSDIYSSAQHLDLHPMGQPKTVPDMINHLIYCDANNIDIDIFEAMKRLERDLMEATTEPTTDELPLSLQLRNTRLGGETQILAAIKAVFGSKETGNLYLDGMISRFKEVFLRNLYKHNPTINWHLHLRECSNILPAKFTPIEKEHPDTLTRTPNTAPFMQPAQGGTSCRLYSALFAALQMPELRTVLEERFNDNRGQLTYTFPNRTIVIDKAEAWTTEGPHISQSAYVNGFGRALKQYCFETGDVTEVLEDSFQIINPETEVDYLFGNRIVKQDHFSAEYRFEDATGRVIKRNQWGSEQVVEMHNKIMCVEYTNQHAISIYYDQDHRQFVYFDNQLGIFALNNSNVLNRLITQGRGMTIIGLA